MLNFAFRLDFKDSVSSFNPGSQCSQKSHFKHYKTMSVFFYGVAEKKDLVKIILRIGALQVKHAHKTTSITISQSQH
jgi:hypothetical protein